MIIFFHIQIAIQSSRRRSMIVLTNAKFRAEGEIHPTKLTDYLKAIAVEHQLVGWARYAQKSSMNLYHLIK